MNYNHGLATRCRSVPLSGTGALPEITASQCITLEALVRITPIPQQWLGVYQCMVETIIVIF